MRVNLLLERMDIQEAFDAFRDLPVPRIEMDADVPYNTRYFVEKSYVGKWFADECQPCCDEEFVLVDLPSYARLYYGIAGLYVILSGQYCEWCAAYFGVYYRKDYQLDLHHLSASQVEKLTFLLREIQQLNIVRFPLTKSQRNFVESLQSKDIPYGSELPKSDPGIHIFFD